MNSEARYGEEYDEALILQLVAEGNEHAFSLLVRRYWNNIYSQALTYLKSAYKAQDLVQEVFIKIWEKRTGLPEVQRFDAYLFIIARNLIISELRKKLTLPLDNRVDQLYPDDASPDTKLSLKQTHEIINGAVALLPQQQRTAFILSREENLSYEEIATRMGLSKETVKKHIHRALNFMRTYIRLHANPLLLFVALYPFLFQ